MNIVIVTNGNLFSFAILRKLFEHRKDDIKFIVFLTARIGNRSTVRSILWLIKETGFRHATFKVLFYAVFKLMDKVCRMFPFIRNTYSIRLWAHRNNIPTMVTADINDPKDVVRIEAFTPDLIVAVGVNQILKKRILEMPPKGCLNIHASDLPRYAGISPYVWVLADNEAQCGITLHFMKETFDTGDIIVQEMIPIRPNDSAFALHYRCCLRQAELVLDVVSAIGAGTVTAYPQDASQRSYFSWPTKECVARLRKNGFRLAKTADFLYAIFKHGPRVA